MPAHVEVDLYDRSNEKSSVKFYLGDNLTAVQYGDLLADLPPVIASLEAVTLAELREYRIVPVVYSESGSLPLDPYAQRELRGMFKCIDLDNENRKFSVGVPCPDLGDMGQEGNDNINLGNAAVIAYATALNVDAVSPWKGEMLVIGGTIEGRNS